MKYTFCIFIFLLIHIFQAGAQEQSRIQSTVNLENVTGPGMEKNNFVPGEKIAFQL